MVKSRDFKFEPRASRGSQALVLIFDLEGFSRFFSQPDVHNYVTNFLNSVFDSMSIIMNGGNDWWAEKKDMGPFKNPIHQKFLGDGALYIWKHGNNNNGLTDKDVMYLANRIWNLKSHFNEIVKNCADRDVPVVDLPRKIRFGLAAGSVYKVTYINSRQVEYIGYPINLASRLQSYCRELGFIASARVGLPEKILKQHKYIKVVAKDLKGFTPEIVIVDKKEYNALDETIKTQLFDELPE